MRTFWTTNPPSVRNISRLSSQTSTGRRLRSDCSRRARAALERDDRRGRKQEQKALGRRQKAAGRRRTEEFLCVLPGAFCLLYTPPLPPASCGYWLTAAVRVHLPKILSIHLKSFVLRRDNMSTYRKILPLLPAMLASALLFISCAGNSDNASTTATSTVTPPPTQKLAVVARPQKIVDLMKARGEQDEAQPTLKVVSPAKDAVITGSKVDVKLDLSGDLKGYMPHKDPTTGKGNHIHVILDNQPYEAYYELGQPFELRNVVA